MSEQKVLKRPCVFFIILAESGNNIDFFVPADMVTVTVQKIVSRQAGKGLANSNVSASTAEKQYFSG